ncbi:MAG TPA: glycerophosphodiester phosphodiesterase family protein [Mycobacteriales bacterium]|jgi:glycerophosphoryl diester phosphodiesterase|nr:glycerophosphodiester phosphodiesterase family protein [Mycobacteriales bacterium]
MRTYSVVVVGADDVGGLPERLAAAAAPVVVEVRNDPADAAFDAPHCATARAVAALLADRDDVVVASADWYSAEVARDAGLRTAFVPPRGVTLAAALAYVTSAGHAECHAHADAVLAEPEAVAAAHAAGCAVVAWGADDAALDRLREAGVDGVRS